MQYPKRSQYKYPKSRYRVRKWAEYEAGLRSRGDLTSWLSEDTINSWREPPSGALVPGSDLSSWFPHSSGYGVEEAGWMRQSRFAEEQIALALRQAVVMTSVSFVLTAFLDPGIHYFHQDEPGGEPVLKAGKPGPCTCIGWPRPRGKVQSRRTSPDPPLCEPLSKSGGTPGPRAPGGPELVAGAGPLQGTPSKTFGSPRVPSARCNGFQADPETGFPAGIGLPGLSCESQGSPAGHLCS